jgi:dipeptidyl aminopeptidase/acylaminoacyl peptidase
MNPKLLVAIASITILGLTTGASAQTNAKTASQGERAKPAVERADMVKAPMVNVPLIPRDVIFGNPDRAAAQLSSDGAYISYLADLDGVMNVFVAPTSDLSKAKPVTSDTSRNIRQYFWAYDNTHILYLQDAGGDENWKLHAVNVKTGQHRDLTPFETIAGPDGNPIMLPSGQPLRPTARLVGISEKFPGEVLVGLNNRNPQFHDVHRVNIATGQLSLMAENNQWAGYVADDDFNLRFAQKMTMDGGTEIYTLKEGAEPELFESIGREDALTTGLGGFDKTGQVAYMLDSRERDTGALFAVDLKTGSRKLLAEDARADAGGSIVHPTEKTIQAVAFTYGRTEWKILDESIKPDLAHLKTVAKGEISISSRTLDDSKWIVSFLQDAGPVKAYLYERGTDGKPGKATYLFSNRTKLEGLPLAPMQDLVIKSRDGLNLVSYLTVPLSADADRDGRPDAPVPMVLMVHGGPWARDSWGFNPYHQWLSNRGYAVLSVNFRGSTGFGKAFLNAGNKEWAGKMHDDLLDAVDWAVENGIADKDKVAIMGGSYGGYATLVGLTMTPDVFACGVDIVGPSNIVTLLNTIPPYWEPLIAMFTERVGDHRTEEGRKFLEARSPLNFVDNIKKPLLIGQGANDPRVKQSESDQIVEIMTKKNIPVSYVLFPDEGHGFARPENNMAFNAVTENFLAVHLGGRAQPIGDDISKSTAQIKAGEDGIPGLAGSGN